MQLSYKTIQINKLICHPSTFLCLETASTSWYGSLTVLQCVSMPYKGTAAGLTQGCLGCRLEVGEGTAAERGVCQHPQRFHRQEGQLLFPSSDW